MSDIVLGSENKVVKKSSGSYSLVEEQTIIKYISFYKSLG